jgi:hypothetical protein
MLAARLDASGVTASEKYFVMGGFVAPTAKWEEFEAEWEMVLATPRYRDRLPERNGKKYAHAKVLAQWPAALREALYAETNYLLKHTVSFAVGITYKHADYDKAYENYPLTRKDGRYGFGFRCALVACCKTVNEEYDDLPLSFLVEKGDPGQGGAVVIFNETANGSATIDEYRKLYNVTSYSVGLKEECGGLQVADMHAYTLLKHLHSPLGRNTGTENRYHGDINILLSGLMHTHFVINKDDIRDQRKLNIEHWLARKAWGQRRMKLSIG